MSCMSENGDLVFVSNAFPRIKPEFIGIDISNSHFVEIGKLDWRIDIASRSGWTGSLFEIEFEKPR